jgi:hypothetical protein
MLRSAVLLLVGLPMLMPPGMCICQFVPCESARPQTSTASEPVQTAQASPEVGSGHSCRCKHRKAAQSPQPTGAEPSRAGQLVGRGGPTHHAPSDHSPLCPVYQAADKSKTVATPPLIVCDFAAEAIDAPVVVTQTFGRRLHPLRSPALLVVPLFVSHCSLVI